MPADDHTDLIVPIDRWEELLRIGAVLGFPPEDQPAIAAMEAVLAADTETWQFHYSDPEVTPGGVIIHRRAEGS